MSDIIYDIWIFKRNTRQNSRKKKKKLIKKS